MSEKTKRAPAGKAEADTTAAELVPVEQLHERHETPSWLAAAAKMKHGWPVGFELTEESYQKALKAAADEPIGASVKKAEVRK